MMIFCDADKASYYDRYYLYLYIIRPNNIFYITFQLSFYIFVSSFRLHFFTIISIVGDICAEACPDITHQGVIYLFKGCWGGRGCRNIFIRGRNAH